MQANAYNEKPRFVVFGGLVFQPVDANFMSAHSPDDLRLRYYFDQFISQNIYRERQEIVVLSNVLADPVNAYASDFRYDIVDKINDQKIQRIDDVAEAFKKPCRLLCYRDGWKQAAAGARTQGGGGGAASASAPVIGSLRTKKIFKNENLRRLSLADFRNRQPFAWAPRPFRDEPSTAVLPVSSDSLGPRQFHKSGFRFFPPLDERRHPIFAADWVSCCTGGQVLVTAELVANRTYVELEKAASAEKSPAEVMVVDYDCNLALIKPANPDFLKDAKPLSTRFRRPRRVTRLSILQFESNGQIADTPGVITTITVAGYPLDHVSLPDLSDQRSASESRGKLHHSRGARWTIARASHALRRSQPDG